MAKSEECNYFPYQVDNDKSLVAGSYSEFLEDKKPIILVKQENNNSILPEKSADNDILKEDIKSNVIEKEELETKDSELPDFEKNKNQKCKKNSGSGGIFSYFTDNVESKNYSRKKFKCRYTCKLCSENFQYTKQLSSHINAHQNGFKCDSCPKVFLKKQSIAAHVVTHIKKLSFCCYCSQSFEEDELLKHLPSHFDEEILKCDKCQSEFSDESSLKSHEIVHADSSEGNEKNVSMEHVNIQVFSSKVNNMSNKITDKHYCSLCERSYWYIHNLKRHTFQKHGKKAVVGNNIKFSHECHTCKKKFRFLSQLKTHQAFHCNLPKLNFDKFTGKYEEKQSDVTKHLQEAHQNESASVSKSFKFNCGICKEKFESLTILKIHRSSHTTRFKCPKCKNTYKYPFDLTRHLRTSHGR